MIPRSVSATSLNAAKNCLAMYKAQHIDYARGLDNDAAKLGTTLHSALELFVKQVYLDKTHANELQMVKDYFDLYFLQMFGTTGDDQNPLWVSGHEMLDRWIERTTFEGKTVISTEQKLFFMVPTSAGPIKLNYIIDRLDQTGPTSYEVIDYKSSAFNIKSGDLWDTLQANIYAFSVYYTHPDATEVKVTFDMLRFAQSSTFFTKDKVKQTYLDIKALLEKIIASDENNLPETLNAGCGFCIRKASCRTLQKNIDAGGIFSLDLNSQIDLRTQIELQSSGLNSLRKELDRVIEETMGKAEQLELSTGPSRAYFTTSKEREITDITAVRRVVGSDIFDRYGQLSIGLGQFDKMLKTEPLTQDQIDQLKALVKHGYKNPSLRYENRRTDDVTGELKQDFSGKLKPAQPVAPVFGLD